MEDYLVFEPKVYVVGVQKLNGEEYYEFLRDAGISEFVTDAPSVGEHLIEVAGRLCYDSYTKKRPGGNKEYIKHILEVGHGCYDDKTEVLTAEGWKLFKDISYEDKVATLGKYNTVEYHAPTNIFEYDYSGDMYEFKCKGVDLLVTPNHKMYVCQARTKKNRKLKNNYSLVPADQIYAENHFHLKTCDGYSIASFSDTYSISIPWAKLLGFAIGDGYLADNSRVLRFHLRRPRKIEYLQTICNELGIEIRRYKNHEDYLVDIPSDYISLFRSIYDEEKIKQIPQEVLLCNDKSVLEALFDGLKNSDGHVDKNGAICYDSTSKKLLSQIQQLCLHIGLTANIGYTKTQEERKSYGSKDLTRLHIITKRGFKPELNRKDKQGKYPQVNKKEYVGKVYCVEVENHVIYVRRNGIPVWCGNSVIEHTVFNFIITGISRYIHSELIRHRTKSFSIRSTRYIDESEGKYVEPKEIYDDPALHGEFIGVLKAARDAYIRIYNRTYKKALIELTNEKWHNDQSEDLAKLDVKEIEKHLTVTDKTKAKKHARGLARVVLPGCLETKVFLTSNVRSLRNFLELRASSHADQEIRVLANKIYNKVSVICPNLFADYTKNYLKDNSFELITENRKV